MIVGGGGEEVAQETEKRRERHCLAPARCLGSNLLSALGINILSGGSGTNQRVRATGLHNRYHPRIKRNLITFE